MTSLFNIKDNLPQPINLISYYRDLLNTGKIKEEGAAHNRLKQLILKQFEKKRKKSIK
tara:strand:- start:5852 stop:6025 length:174 start_codon:yes stop_codon:yes gene_type:complete